MKMKKTTLVAYMRVACYTSSNILIIVSVLSDAVSVDSLCLFDHQQLRRILHWTGSEWRKTAFWETKHINKKTKKNIRQVTVRTISPRNMLQYNNWEKYNGRTVSIDIWKHQNKLLPYLYAWHIWCRWCSEASSGWPSAGTPAASWSLPRSSNLF